MGQKKIPYNFTSKNPIDIYCEVRKSKIHGLGLFAKQLIPKSTIWWHARPQDILIISKIQFLTLEKSFKSSLLEHYFQGLLTYSYYERDLDALIFCLDDSRYVNHSINDNSGASEDENGFCSIALRDIQPGEEITENYCKYTKCSWLEPYKRYFDPSCW
jgi:SET domain-containing protein